MNDHLPFTAVWFHSLAALLLIATIVLYKRPFLRIYLLALFLGIVTAIVDLGTDEVQFPVLLLLVFGFFLGFDQPERAWRRSLLLGAWIPVFEFAKVFLNQEFAKIVPQGLGSLLALIPAFIGTYSGVALQKVATRKQDVISKTTVGARGSQ